jgi:hypothetical protein
VVSIGSPYGMMSPPTFFNTCSSGIISNLVFADDGLPTLLILDAQCSPGSEGGVILDIETGSLIGMIQPPLRCVCVGCFTTIIGRCSHHIIDVEAPRTTLFFNFACRPMNWMLY